MQTTQDDSVEIRIIDKTYQVKCEPENKAQLEEAARFLQKKVEAIRKTQGSSTGADRLTRNVALNLSHELLELRQQINQMNATVESNINNLIQKIDELLSINDERDISTNEQAEV